MEEYSSKVFSSNILRADSQERNNLQDLLEVVPAKPIAVKCEETIDCYFSPKMDKYYVPKKRSRLKVRTVRDIRNLFEQDTYAYLNEDLEKQQTVLLRKIRGGSSNDESTKTFASNVLSSDHPLTRTAWQMLININPQEHLNPKQYVLWKGKQIQINGSRGGKKKIIFNFDRKTSHSMPVKNKPYSKVAKLVKRKGLLQNSLAVKFKPGPLQRKKFLDDSHQRYNIGQIELVDIPKPALQVMPNYGSVFDSSISNILNSVRDEYGIITEKWAEFAVSVLGKTSNKTIIQANEGCCITFDLKYKFNKRKILMRQDVENVSSIARDKSNKINIKSDDNSEITLEVQHVMNDILNAVEISLTEDMVFTKDDPDIRDDEPLIIPDVVTKDKPRKKYAELDRLAVTVIKLPESSQNYKSLPCEKSYCRLGCICDSLNQTFILKQHCGNLECMFGCKCVKSKYKDIELLERGDSELIPGLLNLDRAINSNLAKEEQKFHQTVVLSGQQSILLKDRKRNRQSTKKYADYLRSSNLNSDMKKKTKLMIIENKLDCANIEPWCMVHNLYRCFCKGKFTESSITMNTEINHEKTEIDNNTTISAEEKPAKLHNSLDNNSIKIKLRPRVRVERKISDNDIHYSSCDDSLISTCARTSKYKGRKYSDGYYRNTNNKIQEMEKNDVAMQRKMLKLINGTDDYDIDTNYAKDDSRLSDVYTNQTKLYDSKSSDVDTNQLKSLREELEVTIDKNKPEGSETQDTGSLLVPVAEERRNKLVAWLETSYKIYKERHERGIIKNSLEAPVKNKMALHTWEFISARYRERKNLFLVSKQKPYRIFLAVNQKHSFFDSCINIDDIRFADLNKYPAIVRNLLTNTNDLKDNFCILGGWDSCWELIGSVTKVNAEKQCEQKKIFDTDELVPQTPSKPNNAEKLNQEINSIGSDLERMKDADIGPLPIGNQAESSKWFLMTVEDDFTEIQFYKRGFYVKYDSIVQAINLARMTGKTVRLSSQICSEQNDVPQFGIYATPNINQLCVFVGPYEFSEQLGLETLKKSRPRNLKKTRGVWIITNKVDNMQVINDPLSFMPAKMEHSEIIVAQGSGNGSGDNYNDINNQSTSQNGNDKSDKATEVEVKTTNDKPIVKPIKIRRTNGFYHLSSNSFLKNINKHPVSLLKPNSSYQKTLIINPPDSILKKDDKKDNAEVSEGLSDIKITAVYSEYGETKDKEVAAKKTEQPIGKLILKPDEINKKLLQSQSVKGTSEMSDYIIMDEVDNESDTNFDLLTDQNDPHFNNPNDAKCDENPQFSDLNNQQLSDPNDEVLCISDEDDNIPVVSFDWKYIWIQSTNTRFIYWIPGQINKDNEIRFCKLNCYYSRYYAKDQLFNEINKYLLKKDFITHGVEWKIVESIEELKGKRLTDSSVAKSKFYVDFETLNHSHIGKTLRRPWRRLNRRMKHWVHIPLEDHDIINLSWDELKKRFLKHDLNKVEMSTIIDIRRRGKNKEAAQKCRKRILDEITSLDDEVRTARQRKQTAQRDRHNLLAELQLFKERLTRLYRYVLEHVQIPRDLSDELQHAGGTVMLVPKILDNEHLNNTSDVEIEQETTNVQSYTYKELPILRISSPRRRPLKKLAPKTYARNKTTSDESSRFFQTPHAPNIILINQESNSFQEMEVTSRLLEDKTTTLWNKAKLKETEIIGYLSTPENIPNEMTHELENLIQDFNEEETESSTVLKLFE